MVRLEIYLPYVNPHVSLRAEAHDMLISRLEKILEVQLYDMLGLTKFFFMEL